MSWIHECRSQRFQDGEPPHQLRSTRRCDDLACLPERQLHSLVSSLCILMADTQASLTSSSFILSLGNRNIFPHQDLATKEVSLQIVEQVGTVSRKLKSACGEKPKRDYGAYSR